MCRSGDEKWLLSTYFVQSVFVVANMLSNKWQRRPSMVHRIHDAAFDTDSVEAKAGSL
jgi:hypothetical protein